MQLCLEICIYPTEIKHKFTKYLNESCWMVMKSISPPESKKYQQDSPNEFGQLKYERLESLKKMGDLRQHWQG